MNKNKSYEKYLDFIKNNNDVNKVITLIKLLDIGDVKYGEDIWGDECLIIKIDYIDVKIHYEKGYIGFFVSGQPIANIAVNSLKKYNISTGDSWDKADDNLRYSVISDIFKNTLNKLGEFNMGSEKIK